MMNLVSVIMPVFNAEVFLNETLDSLALQTYTNWELIVIDDGSSDNSIAIYNNFKRNKPDKCKIIVSDRKQSGAAVCRNIGLRNTTGSYVIFLDSDDKLEPFCLQQRVAAMDRNPSCGMAIFKQYKWDSNQVAPFSLFTGNAQNNEEAIEAFMKMDAPWQTMATIWRKTTLKKLNGFDEALVYMEDPDLHLRALLDEDVAVSFEYNLLPDNFYRVNNMSGSKLEIFYTNSIASRLIFLRKWVAVVNRISDVSIRKKYKNFIHIGFFTFLKTFVLARLKNHIEDVKSICTLLVKNSVISKAEMIKLNIVFNIFLSSSPIVKFLRLKGIANKFLY
jgi:glycosyltransferase involved in cell wall biosynthesis